MFDLHDFDASVVDPSVGFDPVPAGRYVAVVTDAEMLDTQQGGGQYLELKFEIIEGEYKGRNLWTRLNLVNSKEKTVDYAKAMLSGLYRALGFTKISEFSELHNLPLLIAVKCKNRKDNGELTNEIKGFEKIGAVSPIMQPTVLPPWSKR